MDKNELRLMRRLDALLKGDAVRERRDDAEWLSCDAARSRIDHLVAKVSRNLAANPQAAMAWAPIPLGAYGVELPAAIRSSWVFILRAGRTTGAERHPNSVQRMVSYRGTGDLQTRPGPRWRSHRMVSDPDAPFTARWRSIPLNTWHQAVVESNENWVVVSFHSVPAADLIEERPAARVTGECVQRRYATAARRSW